MRPDHPSPAAPPQDADLLAMQRLVEGHDAALNELMDRHAPRLFRFLCRHLDNEEDAADLAQEAFVRVYGQRQRFQFNRKFTTWLFAIAVNLLKDRYRWRTRHREVSLDAENSTTGGTLRDALATSAASPTEALQNQERTEAVRLAVQSLPVELRLPLLLAEFEDQSHIEISRILGCSAKAVETRIYRAKRLLCSTLQPLLDPM